MSVSGVAYEFAPLDSLDDNLVVVSDMEGAPTANEPNLVDRAGSIGPFVRNGGDPASIVGQDGNARELLAASSQYFGTAAGTQIFRAKIGWIVGVWFKRKSIGANHSIFGENAVAGGSTMVRINSNNTIQMFVDAAEGVNMNLNPATTFTDTASWHLLVAWFDGKNSQIKFLVDNVLIGTLTVADVRSTDDTVTTTNGFQIGSFGNGATGNPFNGGIDGLSVHTFEAGDLLPGEGNLPTFTEIAGYLWNGGAGRFPTPDPTAPPVALNVTLNRYEDAGGLTRQVLSWGNPVASNFGYVRVGRALDAEAIAPTHVYEDKLNGTIDFVTLGSSTNPAEFAGANAKQGPAFGPSDNFGIIIDPDQADILGSFYIQTVNVGGVAGAWTKATVVEAPDTAPGKATSVSAVAGDARAVLAFTTPAAPTVGTLDRVGIAVSATSAADAATLANAGTFAKIIPNLTASTAFTGRDVAELSGGTDLANGVEHWVIVVPGTSKNVFNVSAVSGDAKSVTPVSGAATIIRQPVGLTVKNVNKITLATRLVNP